MKVVFADLPVQLPQYVQSTAAFAPVHTQWAATPSL
jgi:hypothetical protein